MDFKIWDVTYLIRYKKNIVHGNMFYVCFKNVKGKVKMYFYQ